MVEVVVHRVGVVDVTGEFVEKLLYWGLVEIAPDLFGFLVEHCVDVGLVIELVVGLEAGQEFPVLLGECAFDGRNVVDFRLDRGELSD